MKQKIPFLTKLARFVLSLALACALAFVFSFIPFSPMWAAILTFVIVMVVVTWKQVLDVKRKNQPFYVVFLLLNFLGTAIGSVVAYLANYYSHI